LVAVLVMVALLVALGAALIVGSKRALPPPFGPARNGAVIYSGAAGDIMSVDPATGATSVVIGGPSNDWGPYLSPDGQRILFLRGNAAGADTLYTANIDGSGVKEFGPAKDASWNQWSPNSEQISYVAEGGGTPFIRDVATGTTRPLPVSSPVHTAEWLTDAKLLVGAEPDGSRTYWTINADGTDQRLLETPDACCGASVLPGRGLLAWTSWGTADDTKGRIHILDTASGSDRLLASTQKPGLLFLDAWFSPDGNWLLVSQFVGNVDGVQLGLIAADGSGQFVAIGRKLPKNDSEIRATFSPDGRQVLVTYDDGTAWLYSIPDGKGSKADWPGVVAMSWQRLAVTQ
jgi:Tol biopolymer transport system component